MKLRVPATSLHDRVLGALRDQILVPANIAYVIRQAHEPEPSQEPGPERLDALDVQIARLVEAVAQGGDVPALVARLKATQAERDALARKLAGSSSSTIVTKSPRNSIELRLRSDRS